MAITDLKLLDYDVSPTITDHRPVSDGSTTKDVPYDYHLQKPHQDVFSDLYYGEAAKQEEELQEQQEQQEIVPQEGISILANPTPPTAPDVHPPVGKDLVQGFIDLCKKEGININITSWERPNNTSKAGKKSHHVDGSAVDITPGEGETWESLSSKIKGNQLIYDYMLKNNLGIIDETKPEMQRRTGATGAHWHIGPDLLALRGRELVFNYNATKSSPTYKKQFKTKDVNEFVRTMVKVYSDVLDELGLPKTNLMNLVKQAAIESNYGTDPRGNGYNLGGIKNFTGDDSKGTVNPSDNTSYLNFTDLKDFARYHVRLLNDKYGALAATDSTDFVNRLHGNNPGGRNYSVNRSGYHRMFDNMASVERIFERYNILNNESNNT